MRKGIHREYKSNANEKPRRAWVAEVSGEAGEWLSEAEYRAGGYSPDFDSLPVMVVKRSGPVDIGSLPPDEREYIQAQLKREKDA